MKLHCLTIVIYYCLSVRGQIQSLNNAVPNVASLRINIIIDLITLNLKKNGWSTILCFGNFPDELYVNLQNISLFYPFAISNIDREDEDIEDVVRYYANTIVVNLLDVETYETTVLKLMDSPYWHPHSNIILYYHENNQEILAKIFFSFWYYKAINVIIVQYDDIKETFLIHYYTPFTSDDYKLDHLYGCWTTRKIGMPVSGFDEGFACVQKCHNVSIDSKLRTNNLGTCIGFSTITISYNATNILSTLDLFEEKCKNLHGFKFRVYTNELKPFLIITDHENGSCTLGGRDGILWSSLGRLMNFSFDLTPSVKEMKKSFNFERSINQLFSVVFRKTDFYFTPIYLFDYSIIQVDYTFPYRESGVCILSQRAGFETTLFDAKTLYANLSTIIEFILCFLGIWATFTLYQVAEKGHFHFDQFGKDLLNALRNVLLISLCHPPRRRSFRIFLTVSIWGFFVLNFVYQASIISFLTVAKRGKEVDTFEDMIDKGYFIYGISSPDIILPDNEERYRMINSKLVPVQDYFECIRNLTTEKNRFCLMDCSVAYYMEKNRLNNKGEQYLHVAQQDRMHSLYLTIILTKHSSLSEQFRKYIITFYEAGLIKKWEQYRFAVIKEEPPVKPLGMSDLKSLFNLYFSSLGFLFVLFWLELIRFHGNSILEKFNKKIRNSPIIFKKHTL